MLRKLLNSITELSKTNTDSVNFLTLIGQETRELTHSKVIASLLDPNGAHGQGVLFLRLFVETFLPGKFKDFDYESAMVEVEKDCGNIDFDNENGGRIDIYIEDGNNNVIVIENKIFATDQPNQLGRYSQSVGDSKSFEIIYLTLDGHEPSFTSAKGTSRAHFNQCSYHEHVIQWLHDCLDKMNSNFNLRVILEQYIEVIRKLTEKFKVAKLITSSSSTMYAALLAESSLEIARQMLISDFMASLDNLYYSGYDSAHFDSIIYRDKEGCHLILKRDYLKIDVCIEWRLFIRVSLTKEGREKFPEGLYIPEGWIKCEEPGNIAWRYITIDGEKVDFHNISKPVEQFLDLKDNFRTNIEVLKKTHSDIERAIKEFQV